MKHWEFHIQNFSMQTNRNRIQKPKRTTVDTPTMLIHTIPSEVTTPLPLNATRGSQSIAVAASDWLTIVWLPSERPLASCGQTAASRGRGGARVGGVFKGARATPTPRHWGAGGGCHLYPACSFLSFPAQAKGLGGWE